MHILITIVILHCLLIFGSSSNTTCEDSQRHFSDLCFVPKPLNATQFDWLITKQAPDGLYSIIGNDIERLHRAEVLKGEKLSLSDNFDNICLTVAIQQTDFNNSSNGNFCGFGNLFTNWSCKFSKDFPLLFMCDNVNPGATKYHENFNSYVSYTDNTNFIVEVICYPNGEVGWVASALSKSFTDEEKKTIIHHITSLGFSNENIATMYEEKYCSPNIY